MENKNAVTILVKLVAIDSWRSNHSYPCNSKSLTWKPNKAYSFTGVKSPSLVVDFQEGLNGGMQNATGIILWLLGWSEKMINKTPNNLQKKKKNCSVSVGLLTWIWGFFCCCFFKVAEIKSFCILTLRNMYTSVTFEAMFRDIAGTHVKKWFKSSIHGEC